MDRRQFIQSALMMSCCSGLNPLASSISLAATQSNNRLVVIILRGAMDGMDVVRPVGEADFRKYRPNATPQGEHDLNGFFRLHPALSKLMPLWNNGELAFAHAVSTPYRDKRSHFDGQNLLEAGVFAQPDNSETIDSSTTGWMNRALLYLPGAHGTTAYAVGLDQHVIMQGPAPYSKWTPGQALPISADTRHLLQKIYSKDEIFNKALSKAIEITNKTELAAAGSGAGMMMGNSVTEHLLLGDRMIRNAENLASFTAEKLNGDSRLAVFSLGGWDTHTTQHRTMPMVLAPLETAIMTLRSALGRNWSNTAVMCVTEFGRTALENGARGTDHGTGSAIIMAGGAIKGGRIITKWPGIKTEDLYQGRDLMPTMDVRLFLASALNDLFQIDSSKIERDIFPSISIKDAPKIIL